MKETFKGFGVPPAQSLTIVELTESEASEEIKFLKEELSKSFGNLSFALITKNGIEEQCLVNIFNNTKTKRRLIAARFLFLRSTRLKLTKEETTILSNKITPKILKKFAVLAFDE